MINGYVRRCYLSKTRRKLTILNRDAGRGQTNERAIMHETSWQIELRLRDGDLDTFQVLMDRYRVASRDGAPSSHGYLWSPSDDGTHVIIAKMADMPSTPTVTWSADWPSARQAFARIGAGFTTDLLAVAEPVNLVTYGDDEPETADDTVVNVASVLRRPVRPGNTVKKRVVAHAQASLQFANG